MESEVGRVVVEVWLRLLVFSPLVRAIVGVSEEDLGVHGEVLLPDVDFAASEQAVLMALVRVSETSYPTTAEGVKIDMGSTWL